MKMHIEFTRAPIIPPVSELASRELGACLEFSGIVRELENGKKITGLFYEAYEPMARRKLETILRQLCAAHPCEEAWFIHRLEFVPVGEASLFIRIVSKHRQASLAFMSELINRLKADVPVWKRAGGM
jgi:molybdopterin synthase catalytic subunit